MKLLLSSMLFPRSLYHTLCLQMGGYLEHFAITRALSKLDSELAHMNSMAAKSFDCSGFFVIFFVKCDCYDI
ncbi:hypothetical protein DFH28DRAFT_964429 [Melampsora americana]|nr:hypothetical protein DFH28DRAFT_964429 [Melampsora americana]